MTQKKRMAATKKADALFGKHVRERGVCQLQEMQPETACSGALQWCHIISRSYRAIRWNEENSLCGCQSHHMFFTHRPLEWQAAIDIFEPGLWDELRYRALNDPPMDPKEVITLYKDGNLSLQGDQG